MVAKGDLKVAEPVKDSQQAFERGCDLKDAGCCTSAAVSSMQSSVKDFVRAFKFAEKGSFRDFDFCTVYLLLVKFEFDIIYGKLKRLFLFYLFRLRNGPI